MQEEDVAEDELAELTVVGRVKMSVVESVEGLLEELVALNVALTNAATGGPGKL